MGKWCSFGLQRCILFTHVIYFANSRDPLIGHFHSDERSYILSSEGAFSRNRWQQLFQKAKVIPTLP